MSESNEQIRAARKSFEAWTAQHPADWKLGIVSANGQFHHYMDGDTDTAWMGFLAAWQAPRPDLTDAVREKAIDDAAGAARNNLENWASDLDDTKDSYIEARRTGIHAGRRISPEMAKQFAGEFRQRAEAVQESVEHTVKAILALKTPSPTPAAEDVQESPQP